MKCIIVDDEPKAIAILERYVAKIPELELLGIFDQPLEAAAFLKRNHPDCVFLDINMPDATGLQLSRFIQDIPVVFTTAYPEYALESYEVSAVDYLVKPISFARFLVAFEKLRNRRPKNQQEPVLISIKSGTKTYRIAAGELDYVETRGNNVVFHIKGGNLTARMTVNEVLVIPGLIRIHKSFIVPKDKVLIVEGHQVTTMGGAKLPIGLTYRDQLGQLR